MTNKYMQLNKTCFTAKNMKNDIFYDFSVFNKHLLSET